MPSKGAERPPAVAGEPISEAFYGQVNEAITEVLGMPETTRQELEAKVGAWNLEVMNLAEPTLTGRDEEFFGLLLQRQDLFIERARSFGRSVGAASEPVGSRPAAPEPGREVRDSGPRRVEARSVEEIAESLGITEPKLLQFLKEYEIFFKAGIDLEIEGITEDMKAIVKIKGVPEGQALNLLGYLETLKREIQRRDGLERDLYQGPKTANYQRLMRDGVIKPGVRIEGTYFLSGENEERILRDPQAYFREKFVHLEKPGVIDISHHLRDLEAANEFLDNNKDALVDETIYKKVHKEFEVRMALLRVYNMQWIRVHAFADLQIAADDFKHDRYEWCFNRLAPVLWEMERPENIRQFLNAEERQDSLEAYFDDIYKTVDDNWRKELREVWEFEEEKTPRWIIQLAMNFWRFNGRGALFDATAVDVNAILAISDDKPKGEREVKKDLIKFLNETASRLNVNLTATQIVEIDRETEKVKIAKDVEGEDLSKVVDGQGKVVDIEIKKQIIKHYIGFGRLPSKLKIADVNGVQRYIRVRFANVEKVEKQIPEFALDVKPPQITSFLHRRGAFDSPYRGLFDLNFRFLTRGQGISFLRGALATGYYDYMSWLGAGRFKHEVGSPEAVSLRDNRIITQNQREFIGAMAPDVGGMSDEQEKGIVRDMMNMSFTGYKDTDISDWLGSGGSLESVLKSLEQFLSDPKAFVDPRNSLYLDLYKGLVWLNYVPPRNPELMRKMGVTTRKEEFILGLLKVVMAGFAADPAMREKLASRLVKTPFVDPSFRGLVPRLVMNKVMTELRAAYVIGPGWYAAAQIQHVLSKAGNVGGALLETLLGDFGVKV